MFISLEMVTAGRQETKGSVMKNTKKILEILSNSVRTIFVTVFVQCLNTAYIY